MLKTVLNIFMYLYLPVFTLMCLVICFCILILFAIEILFGMVTMIGSELPIHKTYVNQMERVNAWKQKFVL